MFQTVLLRSAWQLIKMKHLMDAEVHKGGFQKPMICWKELSSLHSQMESSSSTSASPAFHESSLAMRNYSRTGSTGSKGNTHVNNHELSNESSIKSADQIASLDVINDL